MYDDFSSDYDRFVNWAGRLAYEMPFLERILGGLREELRSPLRVLDAACGTGMHAIALAKAGYNVAGADISFRMIERARENAAAAGVEVRFEAVGFGELTGAFGESAFDALLCLGNSLPHLLDEAALISALQDFAACLRPCGLFLTQNRNFDAVIAVRERWMEPQSYRQGDEEWLFLRFYDYDADGLITFNVVSLHRSGEKEWQQRTMATRLRPLRQSELVEALEKAGFNGINCYGDMAGSLFDPQSSGNLVVVARRRS